jgi:acyl-CoA thioester hydrolase
MGDRLTPPAFGVPVRVYFQDTDAGGVTFHGAYLEFFERSRVEWLRERGFNSRTMAEDYQCLFIVRKLQMAYRRPALLDDLLYVTAEIQHLGRAQLTFLQQVFRGEELLAEGTVNLGCVDAGDFRPLPIPVALRDRCLGGIRSDNPASDQSTL